MTLHDYSVSCSNSVVVSKLWKSFMYEKFGEEYLIDFKNNTLNNYKSYCKREYKELVERIKSDYKEKEKSVNSQIREIKKIVSKDKKEIEK